MLDFNRYRYASISLLLVKTRRLRKWVTILVSETREETPWSSWNLKYLWRYLWEFWNTLKKIDLCDSFIITSCNKFWKYSKLERCSLLKINRLDQLRYTNSISFYFMWISFTQFEKLFCCLRSFIFIFIVICPTYHILDVINIIVIFSQQKSLNVIEPFNFTAWRWSKTLNAINIHEFLVYVYEITMWSLNICYGNLCMCFDNVNQYMWALIK